MPIEKNPPISILIVDDDPEFRRLVGLSLRQAGYKVLLASGGKLAADLAEEADVALVDMSMPGMPGTETIPLLRWCNPDLRVIACSGCDEESFGAELKELHVEAFFAKPFPTQRLIERIERLLDCAVA